METFKCINCGEFKESEGPCTCPVCGYRMFQMPYERKDMLASEIERFILAYEVKSISRSDLFFEGKEKDDNRFPSYERIVKYVTGAERTEGFLNNLLETADELKKHYIEQFSNSYAVSFEHISNRIERCDEVLRSAAEILAPEAKINLPPVEWGKTTMLYSEVQDRFLWYSAHDLLNGIEQLAKKIVKFIKSNNLYGNRHKFYPDERKEPYPEDTDFKDLLDDAILKTDEILAKKYVVDIADDGADEIQEMLTCLWSDIELIMTAPLILQNYAYLTEDGGCSEAELLTAIADKLNTRYASFDATVLPIRDRSEDELFDVYNELISYDRYGVLCVAQKKHLRTRENEKKLNAMIGLKAIKESVSKIKAYALSNKDSANLNVHMCFLGNPGTGKTEVARYIAGILYENGILPSDRVVEVDRSGLVSEYFGATAEKTRRVIASAMGGVLFVDEAYALANDAIHGATDYGKEAIDTLVKAMEDYRGKFCVIFAGYRNEMEKMLSSNPGMKSRIQFTLDFPNYSRDELKSIAELMLKNRYTISEAALSRILDVTDVKRKEPNFANARELRNILDQVIMCQNLRSAGTEDRELGIADVNKYIKDAEIILPTAGEGAEKRILTGEEELDRLVGLATVKRMVRKIKAYAKRNKGEADFNLHMCFYGNPGTGKTEVARILSRILYDAGALKEAKLVETDGQGLLGRMVGETAPKTEAKIKDAMNGVLFIDEAYSLTGIRPLNGTATYGDEAIAVLLKEMEDHRGQFCVILAGYKDEMKRMLDSNPGFTSRIQFTLEFPDYSREELSEIAKGFLAKKKYAIEDAALERVLDIAEYFRKQPNFANARTVRNILDQVLMNQNLRTEDSSDDNTIIVSDVDDYLADEGVDLGRLPSARGSIGFV